MRYQTKLVLWCITILFMVAAAFVFMNGCSPAQWAAVQKDAVVAHTVTTPGEPTTQPVLQTGQTVVSVAGATSPTAALVIQGISVLSGILAGFAGGKVTEKGNTKAALTEVANAATGFLPGEWSAVATAALKAAGLHDVADPNVEQTATATQAVAKPAV